MNYHETIERVETRVIPEKMNDLYIRLMMLLTELRQSYAKISLNDIKSNNHYRKKEIGHENREANINQIKSLRKKESDLLEKERNIQDKLINGEQITYKEYVLLESLKEKRDLISKNISSVLKNIHFSNNNIRKNDEQRLISENEIENSRENIKLIIASLTKTIKQIEDKDLGLDRLNGLSVQDKHISELNGLINEYTSKKHLVAPVENIDKLFENSLGIRINMFKDIYNEAVRAVTSYKKRDEIDFEKINELEALYASKLWDKPYSLYPYVDNFLLDISSRHLTEYANIVENINRAYRGELTKEEIVDLKKVIEQENLNTDMAHNYLSYKEADLSKFLSYVLNRTKEVKHTK